MITRLNARKVIVGWPSKGLTPAGLIGLGIVLNYWAPYLLDWGNQILLASIATLGLHILMGMAGLISLGQAALLAIGGLSVGIISAEFGVNQGLLTLPASVMAGCLAGMVFGAPALRVRGIYLAISTLALHFVVSFLGHEYQSARHVGSGIVVEALKFGPWIVDERLEWWVFLIMTVIVIITIIKNWHVSKTGRAFAAIREREIAASSLGVEVGWYKLFSFTASSGIIAFSGALSAYYWRAVSIEAYTLILTLQYIAMALVGGIHTVSGSIIGSGFVILIPRLLSLLSRAGDVQGSLYRASLEYIFYGLVLTIVLLKAPRGIIGWIEKKESTKGQIPQKIESLVIGAPSKIESRMEIDHSMSKMRDDGILLVKGLWTGYGEFVALRNIHLAVQRGEIVAIVGPNGAGKTTLLRSIAGFLPEENGRIIQGEILIDGETVTISEPVKMVKKGVILMPEREKIFTGLTVEENLLIVKNIKGKTVTQRNVQEILKKFPVLKERRKQIAGTLSGGERQQLALASALLCEPKVLLIDELSLGLAPKVTVMLGGILKELRAEYGLSVLIVEQHLSLALQIADYLYILSNGQIVEEGSTKERDWDTVIEEHFLKIS